jgi:hypothetical protein
MGVGPGDQIQSRVGLKLDSLIPTRCLDFTVKFVAPSEQPSTIKSPDNQARSTYKSRLMPNGFACRRGAPKGTAPDRVSITRANRFPHFQLLKRFDCSQATPTKRRNAVFSHQYLSRGGWAGNFLLGFNKQIFQRSINPLYLTRCCNQQSTCVLMTLREERLGT